MPRDREETTVDGGPSTTPEMPAVEDDESTRVDPKPPAAAKKAKPPADDEDDEATKHTGTPKKVREVQKVLEESRRMNAAGGPKPPAKKLHPLVPIGVAIALLAVLLLAINWLTKPAPTEDGGEPQQSGGVRKLFDW